ncbi:Spy/CpxP family protein refolding chaperone [Acidisphaera rubrifaciens]|uniref:Transcriptional regulator n=1 Tax=Acidisphaera rubrifaciens HS-AP3 TaxID=1231350 RepID=A0A0D6P977_9PROT|nr:Spy/CpxP family protein refolding chaperone [Acidisphaera rubrifaciens]GAN78207.1 hypothetical protein Asru_0685_04 [Acidisphaera rubrifaciens HS-AP3]
MTKTIFANGAALAAYVGAACLAVGAMAVPARADMSDMTTAHDFFVAHSFDFPKNFRFSHPGPEWVLQHDADFKLTEKQKAELTSMSKTMFDEMKRLDGVTQNAIGKYAKDAAQVDPSEATMKADIDAIGRSETALAYTMVPYHLKSYALLSPSQKKTFADLLARGEGKK